MITFMCPTHSSPHISSLIRRGAAHLRTNNKQQALFTYFSGRNTRLSSTMARTYESALSHLAALQSNKAITSLFTPPPPSSSSPAGPKQDLNALAIPEMQAWLARAGISTSDLTNSGLRCIHVAGTKGKGSVCAYLTALLSHHSADGEIRKRAGKVGTYTSPHLVSVRERIAIDGEAISRDLFARYFFEVWDACTEAARAELASRRRNSQSSSKKGQEEEKEEEKEEEDEISEEDLAGPATKPFYFRFLTLVALRAFLGEGVRSAVVECGIGGEYDSTNILPAETVTASVVAQLGIDHVGMLGGTLPEIAWHKAGVCKAGRACFTRRLGGGGEEGEEGAETMRVLRKRAEEKNAMLVEVDDADVVRWGGVRASSSSSEKGPGRLEGEFQKYNQALAVLAAREHLRVMAGETPTTTATHQQQQQKLENHRLEDIPASFTSALQYAQLRGRCETRGDEHAPSVTWLIDGAHTAESLTEVARWFVGKVEATDDPDGNTILLFNQQDRDAARLVSGLLRDIETSTSSSSSPDNNNNNNNQGEKKKKQKQLFTHALFTRNDMHPRVPPGKAGEEEAEVEPERDLTVQIAAAKAVQDISPSTTTTTTTRVVDNVSDAVAEIRSMANQDGQRRTTVLVTGSLHLVGALLRTLEPEAED
ncbi:FolC bifunctional protein [Xylaria castorea]|nr:FolC bifunctional protein [Xylaria castorea]